MIYSSTDILNLLGRDALIRREAKVKIVDGKPGFGFEEYVYIYIDKYPTVKDFQATWKVWIVDGGSDFADLVLALMQQVLPGFKLEGKYYTVTEFASDKTVTKSEAEKQLEATQAERERLRKQFNGLSEGLQARLKDVRDGIDGRDGKDGSDGRDGKDGQDGRDGKDGRDLDATETELFDLKDVDEGIPLKDGQVLTRKDGKWTNLFPRSSSWIAGGGGGGTAGAAGVSSTIAWTYHPHDHTEEPGSGHFHTDSADGELVTTFHVSNDTSRGNDIEVLLRDLLNQGYDRIYVALADDLSQAHLYAISSYSETASGFEINVVHIETAGLEPDYQNAKTYEFLFTKSATGGGGGIPEAPIDGDQYARQNGQWTVVADSGIPEAPQDGNFYLRHNGQWVDLATALGIFDNRDFDGGNLTTGTSDSLDNAQLDGGEFTP